MLKGPIEVAVAISFVSSVSRRVA